MKNATGNSLRTQRAIAEFGKAAHHPLCQAWLSLRKWQSEHFKYERDTAASLKLLKDAEQQKKQVCALYEQFHKEGKQKEVIEAVTLLRETNELLKKLKSSYQAQVKLCAYSKEFSQQSEIRLAVEQSRAEGAKDTKALRALRHLKDTVAKPMNDGQKRVLGILKMLRDKTIKATWAKNEAAAGYWEAATGWKRPLSDEFWQGRFTVMEFRSGLEALYGPKVAGDKEGKEVRRTLKGLDITPAKDLPGRKWKEPVPEKRALKRQRGRPRIKPDIEHADLEVVQAIEARRKERGDGFKNAEIYNAKKEYSLKAARQDWKRVASEINRLTLLRGGHKSEAVSTALPAP